MKWRAHIVMERGYYRVFYRRAPVGTVNHDDDPDGRPHAYSADQVPWRHRREATSPAIDWCAARNAARYAVPHEPKRASPYPTNGHCT